MPRKVSEEQIEQARELKGMGKGISEIMRLTGLSRPSVKKYTESEADPEPAPEPVAASEPKAEPLIERAVKAVKEVVSGTPDDPRLQAWLEILTAKASGEPTPRHLRPYEDPRFTGPKRLLVARFLVEHRGESPESAAQDVRAWAMAEHRGEKHCNW